MLTFPVRATKRNLVIFPLNISRTDLTNFCLKKEFSVIIHLPNEIPTIFHKSFPFEFGRFKRFRLNAISYKSDELLRSYSPYVRDCYFEGERQLKFFKSYTKAHCDWECMTNYTVENCGCVKFSMPRNSTTPVCSLLEAACFAYAMETWPGNIESKNSDKPCDCLSTCSDIKYEMSVEADSRLNGLHAQGYLSLGFIQFNEYISEVHESMVAYKIQNFM